MLCGAVVSEEKRRVEGLGGARGREVWRWMDLGPFWGGLRVSLWNYVCILALTMVVVSKRLKVGSGDGI